MATWASRCILSPVASYVEGGGSKARDFYRGIGRVPSEAGGRTRSRPPVVVKRFRRAGRAAQTSSGRLTSTTSPSRKMLTLYPRSCASSGPTAGNVIRRRRPVSGTARSLPESLGWELGNPYRRGAGWATLDTPPGARGLHELPPIAFMVGTDHVGHVTLGKTLRRDHGRRSRTGLAQLPRDPSAEADPPTKNWRSGLFPRGLSRARRRPKPRSPSRRSEVVAEARVRAHLRGRRPTRPRPPRDRARRTFSIGPHEKPLHRLLHAPGRCAV